MGKAKKRILHKTNSSLCMTRESAVSKVFNIFNNKNIDKKEAADLISLFGLTAEELSEAGVCYEDLIALGESIS